MREQGGLAIDQKMVHHILNRIKSFNEWGQSIMLNLVASYKPLSQVRHQTNHSQQAQAHVCIVHASNAPVHIAEGDFPSHEPFGWRQDELPQNGQQFGGNCHE